MLPRKAARSLAAIFGAVVLLASGGAGLHAQESLAPNPLLELTFGQFLQISDNPDLGADPAGTSAIAQTRIGLAFESETRISRLSFTLGGQIESRILNDGQGFDTRLAGRTAALSYARASRDSALGFDINYRRAQLDDIVLNDEFEEEDLILSGGERENLGLSATLAMGIEAPIGLDVTIRHNATDYISAPTDVTPRSDTSLSARLRLATARNAELALTASASQSAYDEERFVSKGYNLGAGVSYDILPVLSLSAELGRSLVEISEETPPGGRDTKQIRGLTGRFSAALDRPNGTLAASLSSALNNTGRRTNLQISRAYELPRGTLAFSIGATASKKTDPRPIVTLSYGQELPRGAFLASLSQETVNARNEEALRSRLALSWQGEINAASSWNAALNLADYTVLSGDKSSTFRTEATLSWRRALTRDWDLEAGYRHIFVDSSSETLRSSNTIFLGLESRISLLP